MPFLARLYRIFIGLMFASGGVALAIFIYFNWYYNRLAVTNFFVGFSLFILLVVLIILALRYAGLMWFAYLQQVEHLEEPPETYVYPMVTVIVPAYNEGKVIDSAVEQLMWLDYPRYEVIVVDDGSTDDTYEKALILAGVYGGHRLRVLTQPNAGKAMALNNGIANARGEYVVCMDGDSALEVQTLKQAVKHFSDPTVGAVAGNVKVANRDNLLTKMQALEYVEGLGMVRTAQAFFRRVNIIPGPMGIFRKDVLMEIGGYLPDTYAEDCELTLRILLAGWKIKYEQQAVAWTEAPETVEALFKQRYRWGRGVLQAIVKHRRELLRPYPEFLDTATLWLLLFESVIWPGLNLFAISFFVFVAVWLGYTNILFFWWTQLTILDVVAALFCVAVEKEDIRLVPHAILNRVFYIPLVDTIKFLAALDELFGVQMGWGKLERFGRI